MFPIENIIRNASAGEKEKLSILVVNETNDDYCEMLANNLPHDFYLVRSLVDFPQWGKQDKPSNIHLLDFVNQIRTRYIDLVIVFNRGAMYEKATQVANSLHVPLIVIDFATSQTKVPCPLGATLNLPDPQMLYTRNGDAAVGHSRFVCRSWVSNIPSLSVEINYPGRTIEKSKDDRFVLIDTTLPEHSVRSLGINPNNGLYTNKIEDAAMYLYLWHNQNTTLFDCMKNRIPVVVPQGAQDIGELVNQQLCLVVESPAIFNDVQNYEKVLKFESVPQIVENAYNYVSQFTEEEFGNKWDNLLGHVCNKGFVRN